MAMSSVERRAHANQAARECRARKKAAAAGLPDPFPIAPRPVSPPPPAKPIEPTPVELAFSRWIRASRAASPRAAAAALADLEELLAVAKRRSPR